MLMLELNKEEIGVLNDVNDSKIAMVISKNIKVASK